MSAAVTLPFADTVPAPAAVCGCCARAYDMAAFRALRPAAGHREFDADGQPMPVDGLVIKLCSGCTSSVAIEVWCLDWPSEGTWDEVCPLVSDEVPDGDPEEEADYRRERARNERLLGWRGP